jgi:hypothetical protein
MLDAQHAQCIDLTDRTLDVEMTIQPIMAKLPSYPLKKSEKIRIKRQPNEFSPIEKIQPHLYWDEKCKCVIDAASPLTLVHQVKA